MTRFYLNPLHFEKWMHQNAGIYSGEYVAGCLLDNFVVVTKRGAAAFYEQYINPNQSDYYVEFQPITETDAAQQVFANFYQFEEKEAAS